MLFQEAPLKYAGHSVRCFIQGQYKFVLPPLLYIADYYHTSRTRGPLANPRADPVALAPAIH